MTEGRHRGPCHVVRLNGAFARRVLETPKRVLAMSGFDA
jgi:hypothetical protein